MFREHLLPFPALNPDINISLRCHNPTVHGHGDAEVIHYLRIILNLYERTHTTTQHMIPHTILAQRNIIERKSMSALPKRGR